MGTPFFANAFLLTTHTRNTPPLGKGEREQGTGWLGLLAGWLGLADGLGLAGWLGWPAGCARWLGCAGWLVWAGGLGLVWVYGSAGMAGGYGVKESVSMYM